MRWTVAWLSIWLAGCAVQPYVPPEVTGASFLERRISQTEGTVRVTVAVPDAIETRSVFGLPLEDLAYTQSLEKFGYVSGVGAAPYRQPRGNLTGDPYFTDGLRALMWISRAPVSLDEIELLDLGQHPGDPGLEKFRD